MSRRSAPAPARALQLAPSARPFRWRGGQFLHTSAVPLGYLSASPGLMDLLRRWKNPAPPEDLLATAGLGDPDGPAGRFVAALARMGFLVDAAEPDPIHGLRPKAGLVRSLNLYPANSCNLRCAYCYATSGPGAGPRLSREHALQAVQAFFRGLDDEAARGGARPRGVRLGFLGGGEPTTNLAVMSAAWELARHEAGERGLGIWAHVVTNGTFGPPALRLLSDPSWHVVVSYDGPRQDTQRPTAAGAGSRARVVANLRALTAAGRRVQTRATVTAAGLGGLRDLVEDAAQLGVPAVQVEPIALLGRGAMTADAIPDPLEFAEAFLAAFRHGLRCGVRLTTAAWSHARVGDGHFCAALTGHLALTPDGFLSSCSEVCDGGDPSDPFVVGRLDSASTRLEVWPVRQRRLAERSGPALPSCQDCFLVDTCGGGCASKARATSGTVFARDERHCVIARRVNPELMADLAEGRLLPDLGWQPLAASMADGQGISGSAIALVPAFARGRWNADPARRPALPIPADSARFFHLPPDP